jgi:D-alanyl-D-alanine carboxypeptidase/D-alanyl-D-alanine-endopeptidase (penicillin-binding protein 4)
MILKGVVLNILIWIFLWVLGSNALATQATLLKKVASLESSSAQPVSALQYRPLVSLLESIVQDPLIADALVGANVESLSTGQNIFSHQPDQLINPASVTKVFTTAAGLALLHPDYTYKTEFFSTRSPRRGVIHGSLYVKGYGDPFLVNERLSLLVHELRLMGIRKIEGPIVIDDSYFDQISTGPGWAQDDSPRSYSAPMNACSLNFNSATLHILPGPTIGSKAILQIDPPSDHFRLKNNVRTGRYSTRIRLTVEDDVNRTRLSARGRVSLYHPGSRQYFKVTSPTWYFARSLRHALKKAGIQVRRTIKMGRVPRLAVKIFTFRSPPLGELTRKINKISQNFMAEQLFKTLGAEFFGPPASWYKGQRVMRAFLKEEVGIAPASYVLHNGSGLNDVNRITAAQAVSVLGYMWNRFDVGPDFISSLAVAGADGTVYRRFRHPSLARTMRLKTGSLERVRTLSGYVHSQGSEVFAFCLLISRYTCSSSEVIQLINRFAAALSRADADHMIAEQIEIAPVSLPETKGDQ